jgi:hypothetical protein
MDAARNPPGGGLRLASAAGILYPKVDLAGYNPGGSVRA